MGLRSRFRSWNERQNAIGGVLNMRRCVEDLRDQTRTPPYDYFSHFEQDDLDELLDRVLTAMDTFIEASDKRVAELRDKER